MPYFIGVIFLSYFGGASLESALIFAVMGLFSIVAAVYAFQNGIRPFKWWDGEFNKHDLKWIGAAYAGLLAVVFVVTPLLGGGSFAILIALGGGGAVLFFSLKKSESILVPWLAHGIYNITAISLATASIITLSASPIYVPNFTLGNGRPADFLTQVILQLAFVSFSEEALKISVALGIFTFIGRKNVAFIISVIAWVGLHTIAAYKIALPS